MGVEEVVGRGGRRANGPLTQGERTVQPEPDDKPSGARGKARHKVRDRARSGEAGAGGEQGGEWRQGASGPFTRDLAANGPFTEVQSSERTAHP
ncbi:hypothetical protein GCM10010428_62470 [Actinosynnema pretiosum subsp. pretiosum]